MYIQRYVISTVILYHWMFIDKIILITGGTGSVGQVLCRSLVKKDLKQLIIFSRDEYKQHQLYLRYQNLLSPEENSKIKFIVGDIKDYDSVKKASIGVDYIIHTAALKHVPVCENNPEEALKVNIEGSKNIVDAALENKVDKVLFISTDKATNPSNTYGATKLLGDKICINGNRYGQTKFSVIRFGNIFGSRGSFVESLFNQDWTDQTVSLTDDKIARVFISWEDLLFQILTALEIMKGGEIFVTKSKSILIKNLIQIIKPDLKIKITGLREGEKLTEILLSKDDVLQTITHQNFYIILSSWCSDKYPNSKKVDPNIVYTSMENEYYTETEIHEMINKASKLKFTN